MASDKEFETPTSHIDEFVSGAAVRVLRTSATTTSAHLVRATVSSGFACFSRVGRCFAHDRAVFGVVPCLACVLV
jgi:hypothetical protein